MCVHIEASQYKGVQIFLSSTVALTGAITLIGILGELRKWYPLGQDGSSIMIGGCLPLCLFFTAALVSIQKGEHKDLPEAPSPQLPLPRSTQPPVDPPPKKGANAHRDEFRDTSTGEIHQRDWEELGLNKIVALDERMIENKKLIFYELIPHRGAYYRALIWRNEQGELHSKFYSYFGAHGIMKQYETLKQQGYQMATDACRDMQSVDPQKYRLDEASRLFAEDINLQPTEFTSSSPLSLFFYCCIWINPEDGIHSEYFLKNAEGKIDWNKRVETLKNSYFTEII